MNRVKCNHSTMRASQIMTLFIILLLSSLRAAPAQAQVSFGLKGGIQLVQMEFNTSAFSASNRAGFFLGPTMRISTPILGMAVDVSAYYDRSTLKVDDHSVNLQRIVLPANLRLGATMFNKIGVFIFGGPQVSFNIDDDMKQWISSTGEHQQYLLQSNSLSLNLGVGVLVGHIEGSLTYNIPLGKTGDFTWDTLTSQLQNEGWSHAKSRTNAWRLAVAYYF